MRILVNGCSFSRGPISWPYYLTGLTDKTGSNVVNLACAGAGNTYIHDTTMRILEKEKFDLVLIMWSGIHRIDQQVEDNMLVDSPYTSRYQKTQNDWPEKIVEPVNDQDFVEDNWSFGCGVLNGETSSELNRLFKEAYRTMGDEEFVNQFIVKIIGLQNTLKQLDIPYVFSFYQPYIDKIKKSTLIDWDNCVVNDNITNIAKRLNSYDEDGFHPGLEANQQWANCVVKHLTQKNII
jgi:hypothetical protein